MSGDACPGSRPVTLRLLCSAVPSQLLGGPYIKAVMNLVFIRPHTLDTHLFLPERQTPENQCYDSFGEKRQREPIKPNKATSDHCQKHPFGSLMSQGGRLTASVLWALGSVLDARKALRPAHSTACVRAAETRVCAVALVASLAEVGELGGWERTGPRPADREAASMKREGLLPAGLQRGLGDGQGRCRCPACSPPDGRAETTVWGCFSCWGN